MLALPLPFSTYLSSPPFPPPVYKQKSPPPTPSQTSSLSPKASLSLSLSLMAPASLHSTQKTVCVMDAAGRVGAALVEGLLRRGYTVHAATQGDPRGLLKLLPSGDAGNRLKVFWSDPFDYQSLLDAMKGCSGLFYAFEPPPEQPNYDEHMVEVEVRAAHNVLEACAHTETVEKVVFTSSVTAVVWKENRSLAVDVDERDWSDPQFCRKFKLWHALAKTLAEKTAWALAMDRDVHMVTINAGLLTGPGLSIVDPYLKGVAEMYDDGVLVTVDDHLLANAHACAFEDPAAYGRYLCFDHAICCPEDATELAKMMTPAAPPRPPPSDGLKIIQQRIHSKKLNKLMVGFDDGAAKEAVH